MLWHRTTAKDKTIWVAVGEDGNRIKDANGKFTTRYENVGGCAYYTTSRATLDKSAVPEEMPDGWPADSHQGMIARFCYGEEARKDWAFLDAWKRRRIRSFTHAGCGENGWTNVPLSTPLTCPQCGVLPGNAILYAKWYTTKDSEGEGVKACVVDAWLTGKRFEYMKGVRILPQKDNPSEIKLMSVPTAKVMTDSTPPPDAKSSSSRSYPAPMPTAPLDPDSVDIWEETPPPYSDIQVLAFLMIALMIGLGLGTFLQMMVDISGLQAK